MASAGGGDAGAIDAPPRPPGGIAEGATRLTLKEYFEGTKDLGVSCFFVVPLLLLYEVGIVAYGSDLRNGAEVLMKTMFSLVGPRGIFVFNILLFVVMAAAAVRVLKRGKPVFALYVPMLLESVIWAILLPWTIRLLGALMPFLMAAGPAAESEPWAVKLFLSVGAGVYEEAVFRLGLLTLFLVLSKKVLKLRDVPAAVVSVVLASALFSFFHHVGPLGEPLVARVFFFRFLAGVYLSALFHLRGFGVVVHAHALYDVYAFLWQS
jgi:hypothetical protein